MRAYLLVLFLLVSPAVFAQPTNYLPVVQQKMQVLQWMAGKWQGPVYLTGGDGQKHEFTQRVEFSPKLKNSVLVLNEAAFRGQDTVFQNIGVLSFNAAQSKYDIQAYTKEGTQIEAEVEALDKKMVWRILLPGTIIRYTINLNEKGQWHQIGEGSTDDGKIWKPFFESTLTRLK